MYLTKNNLSQKLTVYFLIIYSFLLSNVLFSKVLDLKFDHFTIEQGLAQNSAFCILQDKKGFIWVGTEQGLNRFDGYTFVVYHYEYNKPLSLSNNYVNSIIEDSSGIIWIGTNGGGLNRFDTSLQQFTHFYIDQESIDSPSNIIKVVYEDSSGELFIGTSGGGLNKFDKKTGMFSRIGVNTSDVNRLSHQTVNAIKQDSSGRLWVGTDAGLKKLNSDTYQLDSDIIFDQRVISLYEEPSGLLWIGSDKGFYSYSLKSGELNHFTIPSVEKNRFRANQVKVFFQDRFGVFWIGTEYGLYIFDNTSKTFQSFYANRNNQYGLNGNRVSVIFEDRSGALWVGLEAGGIDKLNRTGQNFTSINKMPENSGGTMLPSVFAFQEDQKGILWIGTYGEGLISFDRKNNHYTNYRNIPNNPGSLIDNNIWALCEDRNGLLWIGTAGNGLDVFSPSTGKFSHLQNQLQNPNSLSNDFISSILEDKKGNLWIATNGGLNKLDPQRKQFTHYFSQPNQPKTLAHNNVYILFQDREGVCWIGTKGGLSRFDFESESFTTYRINPHNPNSLLQPTIFSLWEDRDGILWIGTTGGLHKFHKEKGTFSLYTEKDGLPNDVINGILDDSEGNLWLSTNKGISRFNPKTGKFKNYGVEDGLQGYEFSGGAYYKNQKGELFFGGLTGFNVFFPDQIKDNPYIPPVVITNFKIFNQDVPINEPLKGQVILNRSISEVDNVTLTHLHNAFSFEYAALSYIYSGENEYAYMMDGIDDSWNYVGKRRFVVYANLTPGNYVFKVKASNNHGVWNEKGVALKITILPPFWLTWWFKTLIVLLIAIAVVLVFWIRTRLILRMNRELEETVAKRTTALRESEEKYRTLVERAHSGIIVVQDEEIVFKNTQFSNLLGFDNGEIDHLILPELVTPDKQSQIRDILASSGKRDHITGNVETLLAHKEGHHIPVEISYGSIKFKKRPALLMFFSDIRMQKLLEEERMKRAKLESTRILAGGIAHDFNNLLTIIMGNIELAMADLEPSDALFKALSDAEKSSMKAVDLVRRFLTLSKGNAPSKKVQSLHKIIRDAVNPVLQSSGVKFILNFPDDLWPVNCDFQQIAQCLENIVINAKQAMPANGVLEIFGKNDELTLEQIPGQIAGKYVCIFIKDNGCGIPKEDLPKIFDPYFSTKDNVTQKGLGLGLAVVQSIISKHDGVIKIDSEVNKGTTVRICLPAAVS